MLNKRSKAVPVKLIAIGRDPSAVDEMYLLGFLTYFDVTIAMGAVACG